MIGRDCDNDKWNIFLQVLKDVLPFYVSKIHENNIYFSPKNLIL